MIVPVVVEGQSLRWYGGIPEIANNSIEFVQLEFRLPEDWDDMVIVAQFTQTKTYNCLLVNNRCFLPRELVTGSCEVSVFGYLNEKVTRGTTIPLKFNIIKSGFVSSADTPIPPTPDLYAQLIKEFGETSKQKIQDIVDEYLDENPTVIYTPVVEETGESITLSWTNDGGLPNPKPATIPKPPRDVLTADSAGEGLIVKVDEGTLEVVTVTHDQMATAGLTGYLVGDGTVTAYANNYVSDFIEITKGSTVQYHVNAIAGVAKVLCYYDTDKKFIGSVDAVGTSGSFTACIGEINLPENAAYIRYSMAKSATTDGINSPGKQYVVYSTGGPPVGVPVLRVDPEFIRENSGDHSEEIEALYVEKTASGKIVTVTDALAENLRGLTVNDGTAVEAVKVVGRNFFRCDTAGTTSNIGVTWYYDPKTQEFIFNGTTTTPGDMELVNPYKIDWIVGEKYTVSVRHTGGTATLADGTGGTTYAFGIFASNASKYIRGSTALKEFAEVYNFTATAFDFASYIFYFQCWRPGTVFDNYRIKVQVERGEKASKWEPYEEASATLDDVQALALKAGYNNILTSPMADITVQYFVTPKSYIDDLTDGKTDWYGKKWFAFGTSITDTGYINAETGTPTGKYVPYLAELSGLQVTNKGIAGGTIGKGGAYGGSASILNKILTTDVSGADLITIEGFVNDFACEVPIGELGDTGGTDAVADTETITICGALYRAVKHCLETAPNAIVILLTESTGKVYTLKNGQTANYCFDIFKGTNNLCQKDYNDAIINMGRFMGIRVIDAGSKSQINCFNPEYIVDQIHHTELGGKQYATVVWDELKNISPKVTEVKAL